MRFIVHTIIVVCTLLVATTSVSHADITSRTGGDNQDGGAAKAQYLMRQMATERDSLQGENSKLKEQLDKLQKDLDVRKKEVDRIKKSLATSGDEKIHSEEKYKALNDRLIQTREKFQEVIDKFKETITTLKGVEAERNKLSMMLAEKNREIDDRTLEVTSCIQKNIDLYQSDLDLVKQYENKGVWTSLLQKEPVTRLKQVDIENAVQEYKTRLNLLRVTQPAQRSSQQ